MKKCPGLKSFVTLKLHTVHNLGVCVLGRGAARPELRGTTVKEVTAALPSVL